MSSYTEMKERHQIEVNAFPISFAFSNKQFEEGMKQLGLDPSETDKVYSLGGTGGFYRRTDAPALHEMFARHECERQEAMAADETGDGYIFEMFDYELANHEYSYTGDASDTLDALDLTYEQIAADPRLRHGFEKAKKHQRDCF